MVLEQHCQKWLEKQTSTHQEEDDIGKKTDNDKRVDIRNVVEANRVSFQAQFKLLLWRMVI